MKNATAPASPLRKAGEIGVISSIVGLLVIMVIPLPSALLSLLIILNIGLALVILMVAMYIGKPLEFSVFPSLLLIMTLFDLALHISATRLILTQANAGEVIRGFGEVMTGGNPGVGLVLFIIITIVQFIVITKGAERVSEVTARFTLDAMPGKQMSIDADLNAGLITNDEAKARRAEINEEASFYGAMDGASKFVKGNVIAGFVIILINIVGGICVGFFKGQMSWSDIFRTYTLLTIGEGLVIIIPSLLIAVAAAILITRAASGSNLGADSITQLFSRPKALRVVAVTLLLFALAGLVTALPVFPFLLMSVVLFTVANLVERRQRTEAEARARPSGAPEEPASVVAPFLLVPPVELELGYGLLGLVDTERKGNLLTRIKMVRQNLAVELGVVVPPIRVKDSLKLGQNAYSLKIKGVERAQHDIYPGHFLVMNPSGLKGNLPGIKTQEPTFGLDAVWITETGKERAEALGNTVVDAGTVLITNLMEVLRNNAQEILGRQEVQVLVDNLRPNYPAVVDDLVPNLLTLGEIQQVLQNLLRERIPIRDLVTIFEALSTSARVSKDGDALTESVRIALGASICQQFQSERNILSVVTLDPGLERLIADSVQTTPRGYAYGVEPNLLQRMYAQFTKTVQAVLPKVRYPVVLCSPQVRLHVKRLTERTVPQLVVLSYHEVPQQFKVQSLGMITLENDLKVSIA
jgi:flagellar biosynthesis protein FlhA